MKNLFFTFLLTCFSLSVFAQQSLLPTPALKYSCDAITNNYELAPTTGSITAVITDLSGDAAYKSDASIVNDPERGDVLFLPNVWADPNDAITQNSNNRSLRIISDASLVGSENFTISFWTKAEYVDGKTVNGFPQLMIFDDTNIQLRISAWWNDSKMSLQASGQNLNSNLAPAEYIFDWANYVIVKNGSNLSFYVNSVLQASISNYSVSNADLKKLRFNSQACELGSYFDDIQLFHEALNIEQIIELNEGAPVTPSSQMLAAFEDASIDLLSISTTTVAYNSSFFTVEPSNGDNTVRTGLNTTEKCLVAVNNVNTPNWWGNFVALVLDNPITISNDNRFLKLSAYRSTQLNSFRISINNSPGGNIVYDSKLSQDAVWQNLVIDLGAYIGTDLEYISIAFDCNWGDPQDNNEVTYMFDNFELSNNMSLPLTVSIDAYPSEGGNTTGSSAPGYYSPGHNLTLTAAANPDYTFAGWYLNGALVSALTNYTPSVSGSEALNYIAYFKNNSDVYSDLEVKGNYYVIEDLEKGKQLFRNRDNMPLEDIPADFTGWNFIKISASSGYNPIGNGEAPEIQIQTSTNGYVYAMIATYEQPANVEAWATENGWESVPVYSLAYGIDDPAKVFSFYRKEFAAGTWHTIIFPNVFSRATIIAPNIGEEGTFTGIEDIFRKKSIISEALFTLSGMRISSDISDLQNGIYIVKTVYRDGSSDSKKIVVTTR